MKWFYTLRGHVKGPFENEEFEVTLQNLGADIKETWVWTRGKAEWTEAERWTPADAQQINAQAQSAAVMQAIHNQNKADQKKQTEKAAAQTQQSVQKSSSAQAQPTAQPKIQSQQQAAPKVKQKPILEPLQQQPTELKTLKVEPADQQKLGEPTDIIMPTDDEITKLLGVTATEVIESIKEKSDEKFKVQFNGVDQPPMNKEQLIQFTAAQEDPSLIMVFSKKQNEWKEIYTFPDVIEKLGLSRRQNRRVTLLGNFKGKINHGQEMTARLTTVSMGGFGLTDVYDLKIGDSVQGQITSPHFYTPLSIEGEVTYAGQHGSIGLKFTKISDEGQALVTDYIKKFGQGIKTEPV